MERKRDESDRPATAREAVVQARQLEDKALKCFMIAQRMLPGSEESMLEDQATDLMFLPDQAITATMRRQSELATQVDKIEIPYEIPHAPFVRKTTRYQMLKRTP